MNAKQISLSQLILVVSLMLIFNGAIHAQSVSFDNLIAPEPNLPEEPIADSFSLEQATHFLDSVSLQWQKDHGCMTCHTNYAYLYARPLIDSESPAHDEVRLFAEQLVEQRWETAGPRWDSEVVATASALAFHDRATTGELHEATQAALDRMWTIQRDDGGWTWLKCGWPPMESDDHYGVTVAAIAISVASQEYRDSDQAQEGIEGIRRYLETNEAENLHQLAMMVWASSYDIEWISDDDQRIIIERLQELQKPDGGWALATLGEWERSDGGQQNLEDSDGYGTGFVTYVLLRAGVPPNDPAIESGIAWLHENQRESGRWFTRSLNRDGNHFLTHIGTAVAVMAIQEWNTRLNLNSVGSSQMP